MGTSGPMEGKGGEGVVKDDPMLWGRPGHLSQEQADVYVSFTISVYSNYTIDIA